MLKTRIIPCLDVAEGRVVKGVNFVDLIDAGDPVDAASAYNAAGKPGHDVRSGHPHGGTVLHAADYWWRRADTS